MEEASTWFTRENVMRSFDEMGDTLTRRNAENTEKYRKGEMTLRFPAGEHLVTVKQVKHAFLFGSTAFMLGSFEKEEKETRFRKEFLRLFNQAVVPFYWTGIEPEEGQLRFTEDSPFLYRRPAPDTVLRFCRENGIEPKGHCLAWHEAVPAWLADHTPEERKEILERRFRQIAERYADAIPSFDIINESCSDQPRGISRLFPNYEEYALELGQKYFPHNRKIINETNEALWLNYSRTGKYNPFAFQLTEFLRRGLPFDEIGLQYHIFVKKETWSAAKHKLGMNPINSFLNAENMLGLLDLFDRFGLPMNLSEITIPSYWGGDAEKEEAQAALAEMLYRIWFATPHMKSIVWWNLVDGYAAKAPIGVGEGENIYGGGLLRFDLSEKPAYRALDRLINREWHTETTVKCADTLSLRAFFGDYEITVEDARGKRTEKISFTKDRSEFSVL